MDHPPLDDWISSNSIARSVGPPLSHLPHCDCDDRRARSDRELVCGRHRAYAPDATGQAEWRFCCSSEVSVSREAGETSATGRFGK